MVLQALLNCAKWHATVAFCTTATGDAVQGETLAARGAARANGAG